MTADLPPSRDRRLHLLIVAIATIAILALAAAATVPTYRVAPVFLLPVIWAIYLLRRRLGLRPLHHALLDSAILLHMSGAVGFYQRSPFPFSFDIAVHYYFALVVTLVLHRALEVNFSMKRWQLNLLTFMFMMGLASMHEIMEYSTYLTLGEEKGMLKPSTSYFFDTQRDLLNNLLGTLTALGLIAGTRRIQSRRLSSAREASRDSASRPDESPDPRFFADRDG